MAFFAFPPLNWRQWQTRFLFFTGKGGVGKTTIAATTALQLADAGRRTLIVSTDPASNLNDVFEMAAGPEITAAPGVPGLFVMNLDPEAAARSYRERVVGPYRGHLPDALVRSIEEQLSGACTVEIAAFTEFTRLLSDAALIQRFDHILFDTAPTGHTLRLLTLPSAWSGYLGTGSHGASCLGPLAGLDAQREQYETTVQALTDHTRTTTILVSRLERSALREAGRTSSELAALGITHQQLVLNGVFSAPTLDDPVAMAVGTRQQEALQELPDVLAALPTSTVPLVASDLTGIAALRTLKNASTARQETPSRAEKTSGDHEKSILNPLDTLVQRLAAEGRGVIMTMGKGGVGKTTLAAALALRLVTLGHRVHLSTTDPAAHLAQTLGSELPAGLILSRIDPVAETRRYQEDILQSVGELDHEARALLEEDLRSPCTEEIAVFRAFARTLTAAEDDIVVLDTAPTGHTLLLLDAAQSYQREVARSTGQVPDDVRALLPRLRDPAYTKVLLVTLAETTPVQEAQRLQADLRRAGIEPYGWVINASLCASGTTHPLLAHRAMQEQRIISSVIQQHTSQTWFVPWSARPPQGPMALLALTASVQGSVKAR